MSLPFSFVSFGSSTRILAKFWKSNYDRDLKIIISTCWNKDYLWHERIYDRYSSLPLASFEILCIYKTLVHKCHLILIKNIQSFPVTVFHRRSPMERQEELQRKLTFHLTNHYIQHHSKMMKVVALQYNFVIGFTSVAALKRPFFRSSARVFAEAVSNRTELPSNVGIETLSPLKRSEKPTHVVLLL